MNIFITGKPGCGKSTLIKEIIEELKEEKIAGIISPEIRNKERIGFKIIDLASKKEEILASVELKKSPRVGKYKVNVGGVNKIIDEFLKSCFQADFIFIDELGKMELYSEKFRDLIDKILKSDKKIVVALHRNLTGKYKNKGKLFYLERQNFDKTKEDILKEIGE